MQDIKDIPDYFEYAPRQSHVEIEDVFFELTCLACPEQYCAFYKGEQVGYVRLRWGRLVLQVPDAGGDVLYEVYWHDEPELGVFPDEESREHHLRTIARILKQRNKGE